MDRVFAGPGNDTVHSIDGDNFTDVVDCGTNYVAGADVAYVGSWDTVIDCEVVFRQVLSDQDGTLGL